MKSKQKKALKRAQAELSHENTEHHRANTIKGRSNLANPSKADTVHIKLIARPGAQRVEANINGQAMNFVYDEEYDVHKAFADILEGMGVLASRSKASKAAPKKQDEAKPKAPVKKAAKKKAVKKKATKKKK